MGIEFSAIWGNRWSSNYQDKDIAQRLIANWHEVLKELSDEQIAFAIKKCRVSCEWTPSIAEFRNAALGILPPDDAWVLLVSNRAEENSIVAECKRKYWHEIGRLEMGDARRFFLSCYNLELQKINNV